MTTIEEAPGRSTIWLDSRAPTALPAADAVRVGDMLFVAAQAALGADDTILCHGDPRGQARHVFDRIAAVLESAGGSLADVVEVVSFHADVRDIPAVLHEARPYFDAARPAWTPVGMVGCQHPGALVSVRATAHLGAAAKQRILPESQAWLEAYPVSAAVRAGDLVFIAGQSAADRDGRLARPLDHRRQARVAYDRMLEIVQLCGGSADDILDFASFHHDIRGAIPTLEDVYIPEIMGRDRDTDESASTSHIGATGLMHPDMLGVYGATVDLSPGPRVGSTPDTIWWKGTYPIAGAARKQGGSLVTVAGQVASAPDGSVLHPGDLEEQARFILAEMRETLEGVGLTMRDVAQVSSYHKDARCWGTVMRVAGEFFDPGAPPAWTFVAVPGLWFEGYLHEISATVVTRSGTT
jgi:enamine deaminase RidA (YjgF/YER057c/UK114 family)